MTFAGPARVAALGEAVLVGGYALAGAEVLAAENGPAARAAWQALSPDIGLVLLTPAAAAAVGDGARRSRRDLLTVVLP